MKLSELKRILELIVYTILGFFGGVWVSRMYVQNINDTEYFQLLATGLGTAVSMLTLYVLTRQVEESEKDRKQIIEENKKTRHASHLSEQLGFYSKLRGGLSPLLFLEETIHPRKQFMRRFYCDFLKQLNASDTKSKYEKWAYDELQNLFSKFFTYYSTNYDDACAYLVKQGEEEGRGNEALHAFLISILDLVNKDYEDLIQKYRSITFTDIEVETT